MNLNEEVDCNAPNPGSPVGRREPAQCNHYLRCALHDGHTTISGGIVGTIGQDHWAPHGGANQATEHASLRSASGVYWKSDASIIGGRTLPADDLEEAAEILELARMILADPQRNDHLLHLDETGWTLKHPIRERLENVLFECEFNPLSDLLSEEWNDDANQPGVYKVEIIPTPTGPVLGLQRTPDDA